MKATEAELVDFSGPDDPVSAAIITNSTADGVNIRL